MGIKLSDVEAGNKITLLVSNELKHISIDAYIKKSIDDNISIIKLGCKSNQPLNFSNVKVQVEYKAEDGFPYIWSTAQITNFHSEYVLQVKNEAVRNNRRECFRVGISNNGRMWMPGKGEINVMIRDISLSGFSISDRSKYLNLEMGNEVKLSYTDLGYELKLAGEVVRIEEREDIVIYGFRIKNICKDLSAYLNAKQRQNRH